MSHVTTLKTSIKFKDLGLLIKAVQEVGELTNVYRDYYNKAHACAVGVRTKAFKRGIGFVLKDGVYVPQVDEYEHEEEVRSILNQVQQKYQSAAVQRALRRQKYSGIQVKEKDGVIQIHARRY